MEHQVQFGRRGLLGATTAALALVAVLLFARVPAPAQALSLPGGAGPTVSALLRRVADDMAWRAPWAWPWQRPAPASGPLLSPASRPAAAGLPAAGAPQGMDAVATVFDARALAALRRRAAASKPAAAPAPAPPAAEATAAPLPGAPSPADGAAPFDPALSSLLARLESISYCADTAGVAAWNCTRCAGVPGFVTHLSHFDAEWDLAGYAGYLPSLDAKVIVFRGTDSSSWGNWVNNMRAWRTDATYPVPGAPKAMRIHSGFHVLWSSSSMAATFTAAYARMLAAHPRGPTFILGHSMGGALAHLCALDLRAAFDPPDLRVFTFGSPRVGNGPFADFFDAHVAQSWRFTHGRDIVPSVPPSYFGFRHVSREVWVVDVAGPPSPSPGGGGDVEERLVVCDDTAGKEDPTCHASVCHLGMCTSIADHLVYLGAHMWAGTEC